MKTHIQQILIALTLFASVHQLAAQGTAFTYEGRLTVGGNSSTNGSYDFQFHVFDTAPVGTGTSYGSPNPNTTNGVAVSNGLFTVTLNFGTGVFTGPDRWLQIFVRTNGNGAYTTLSPRQPLTPTPYAIYSGNAAQLGGQGASTYVAKTGDTMTGTLNLPANGLTVGGNQLIASGGNVGIGTTSPEGTLSVFNSLTDTIIKLEDRRADSSSSFLSKQSFYDYYSEGAYIGLRHNGGLSPGVRALVFGVSDANSGPASEKMRITTDGYVGIGTTTPNTPLDVNGIITATFGVFDGFAGGIATGGPKPILSVTNTSSLGYGISAGGTTAVQAISQSGNSAYLSGSAYAGAFFGNVGIGTSQPGGKLHVFGNSAPGSNIPANTAMLASGDGFNNRFMSANSNQAVYLSMYNDGQSDYGELSAFDFGTGQGLELKLNANGGTVSVPVLEIRGGSDLAEPFQMSNEEISKGSLVIIDDVNPGHLKMSNHAYDTRVAGIVSGANGINPGISLHQDGAFAGGENVALSGRVYALADASFGAIKPGDMLTTSSTPGHCMKVTNHAKAQGAIIGKAMSSLEKGKGMVLVLVSLQ